MLNIEINIQVTVCVKKMRVSLQMHMLIIKIPFPCFKFNLKTIFLRCGIIRNMGADQCKLL